MNIPNTMMRNANSRRGGMRSDAAVPAFIIEVGAVVASAMISPEQARRAFARGLQENYCG